MKNFHRDLEEFGKKLDEKLRAYEHFHGKLPKDGPGARLRRMQQAQADLVARANAAGQSGWDAAKITLEAERKALAEDFSTWVALIDAEYRGEI